MKISLRMAKMGPLRSILVTTVPTALKLKKFRSYPWGVNTMMGLKINRGAQKGMETMNAKLCGILAAFTECRRRGMQCVAVGFMAAGL